MTFENSNIQKMIYEDEDITFNSNDPELILPPLPENECLMDFQEDLPPPPTNEELEEMETGQGKYPFSVAKS